MSMEIINKIKITLIIAILVILGTGCPNDIIIKLATITTTNVSSITNSSAISGGIITSDGGSAIIFCGVCWNTAGSPTITDSITTDVLVSGTFTSLLTGLMPNTQYYVRAYATSNVGTSYGNEISFS